MGNFYTNFTLRGPSQQAVAAALAGRSAFITPEQNGCVVVFDEQSDEQDTQVIAALGGELSQKLNCAVLAVLNHDDDILWYQLYERGQLVDEYDSTPGYFDPNAGLSPPAGGDAQTLCRAFGVDSVMDVDRILHTSTFDDDGYAFAVERHADLARALGIPEFVAGGGFRYASEGELPDGLDEADLLRPE